MLRSDVILSSFGAIRMEQYSHQTLRSPVSTTATLSIFIFFINSFLFRQAHVAAFEHGKRWLCLAGAGARIPSGYRSAIAFRRRGLRFSRAVIENPLWPKSTEWSPFTLKATILGKASSDLGV